MKIKFLGGVSRVTGSCTWLKYEEADIEFLIDCGMVQGDLYQDVLNERKFKFNPRKLDFVLLTHAHLDHCGLIPRLYDEGFRGKVICTSATAKLTKEVLLDAVNINAPYTKGSIQKIDFLPLDENFKVNKPIPINNIIPGLEGFLAIYFLRSSHILGSVSIGICWGDEVEKSILFSGDLGNNTEKNAYQPLLKDIQMPYDGTDYIVLESTYGSRYREESFKSFENKIKTLENTIKNTLVVKQGQLIIPTFSLHRTQEILFDLYYIFTQRKNLMTTFPSFKIDVCDKFINEEGFSYKKYKKYILDNILLKEEDRLLINDNLIFLSFGDLTEDQYRNMIITANALEKEVLQEYFTYSDGYYKINKSLENIEEEDKERIFNILVENESDNIRLKFKQDIESQDYKRIIKLFKKLAYIRYTNKYGFNIITLSKNIFENKLINEKDKKFIKNSLYYYSFGDLGCNQLEKYIKKLSKKEGEFLRSCYQPTDNNKTHYELKEDINDDLKDKLTSILLKCDYTWIGLKFRENLSEKNKERCLDIFREAYYEKPSSVRIRLDSKLGKKMTEIYGEEINRRKKGKSKLLYRNSRIKEWLGLTKEEVDEVFEKIFSNKASNNAIIEFNDFTISYVKTSQIDTKEPGIILTSSGMCNAGPVLNHLKNFLTNGKNTILLTGFQAENTPGYRLKQLIDLPQEDKINQTIELSVLKGRKFKEYKLSGADVNADIVDVSPYYSGHADLNGLLNYIFSNYHGDNIYTTLFLNHGDDESREELKRTIEERSKDQANNKLRKIEAVELPQNDSGWYDLDQGAWIEESDENNIMNSNQKELSKAIRYHADAIKELSNTLKLLLVNNIDFNEDALMGIFGSDNIEDTI
ncbi:MAG: MBL fold metallo-hydrolase [Halanaerobiales bacterium]